MNKTFYNFMLISLPINAEQIEKVFGYGSFNFNRSQIELPSSGSNYEEVILRQKQLASSYDYYTYLGLSYTFGSLYNNIVNTRFD